MDTVSKRDRAYDFLKEHLENTPKATALLDAVVNILSADTFIDMVEDEFGWEDEEEIEEEDSDDPPDSWEDDARFERNFLNEP